MKFYRMPPRSVKIRSPFWKIGWVLSELERLPKLVSSDVVIAAQKLTANEILGFEISVIGNAATPRPHILAFPVIDRHQLGNAIRVEVEAFLVSQPFDE